jgi:hypothetical protein
MKGAQMRGVGTEGASSMRMQYGSTSSHTSALVVRAAADSMQRQLMCGSVDGDGPDG